MVPICRMAMKILLSKTTRRIHCTDKSDWQLSSPAIEDNVIGLFSREHSMVKEGGRRADTTGSVDLHLGSFPAIPGPDLDAYLVSMSIEKGYFNGQSVG